MDPVVAQHEMKLHQLLQSFVQTGCQTTNDTYLNKLLTHLTEKDFVDGTQIEAWIQDATLQWEAMGAPAPNIGAFALNLAAHLSKSEVRFTAINAICSRLVDVLGARQPQAAPVVKLAYIRLLGAFLEHPPGVELLSTNEFYKDVLRLALENQTVFITRESHDFLTRLLKVASGRDEGFALSVAAEIIAPLDEPAYRALISSEICDEIVYRNLSPSLRFLGALFEALIKGGLREERDVKVVLMFLRGLNLEQKIQNFLAISQGKDLMFEVGKLMFIVQFLEMFVNVEGAQGCIRKVMGMLSGNITRGHYDNFLRFCYLGQFYRSTIGYKIPAVQVKRKVGIVPFADQLGLYQLCAIMLVPGVLPSANTAEDDLREQYINKVWNMLDENTMRMGYLWRDYLVSIDNLFTVATKSLSYIMQSRKYYSQSAAVLAFQSFLYVFKDIMMTVKDHPERIDAFAREEAFFSLFFDAIPIFIEEFKITWRDSVETICILSVCLDFFTIVSWPTSYVVRVLKLVNVSLAKYMVPNLALLVDRTNDSSMAVMGPLLYAKLIDAAWEVRDTTLEVLCTIAHMSSTKFPSLRIVLLEPELPALVVEMCSHDSVSFVRATALKCLQAMVQVDEIWKTVLKDKDLPQKIRQILFNETEGIVRVEAAALMSITFEQQPYSPQDIDTIHETMVHAATADLHWEVKVRSLDFWDKVIKAELHNQGMIDGAFPPVTFSKEHRKIITLTDSEIRKQLIKVLQQLSKSGCLGVLTSAIRDDCDVEVAKAATRITQELARLLNRYNLQGDPSGERQNGVSSSTSISSGVSMDDSPIVIPDFNDEVIDQIVNAKDSFLLKNVYAPSDYGSVSNYDVQVRSIVSPNEFLQFAKQDLDGMIVEKTSWLNGMQDLESLLDDMLKTYDGSVNTMDCY